MPPLRSSFRKKDGENNFDQEFLDKKNQEAMLRDVLQISLDMNFIHVQLTHAYQATSSFLKIGTGEEWKPPSSIFFDAKQD